MQPVRNQEGVLVTAPEEIMAATTEHYEKAFNYKSETDETVIDVLDELDIDITLCESPSI